MTLIGSEQTTSSLVVMINYTELELGKRAVAFAEVVLYELHAALSAIKRGCKKLKCLITAKTLTCGDIGDGAFVLMLRVILAPHDDN